MSQTKAQLLGPVLGTVEYAGDVNFDSGTLFVDSVNNKVGIGTDAPSNKLDVYNNSTQGNPNSHTPSAATLRIQDNSNSLYFDGNSIIGTGAGDLHVGNASNTAMNLWTNGENRLHITPDGNIGINQTNPAAKFDVDGSAIISNSNPGVGGTVLFVSDDGSSTTAGDSSTFRVANNGGNSAYSVFEAQSGSGLLVFKNDGKLGIGTATPSDSIETYGGDILLSNNAVGVNNGTGPNNQIKFEYNGHNYAKIVGNGRDSSGYGDIDFYTSNSAGVTNLTQRMTIRADGKVGIGTDNPTDQVSIWSESPSTVFRGHLTLHSTETSGAADTGAALALFGHDGSNARTWGVIRGMKENSTGGDTASYMSFYTRASGNNPEEKVRISSTGNVGIGTDNPLEKLDIRGDTYTTGVFYGGRDEGSIDDLTRYGLLNTGSANFYNTYTSGNGDQAGLGFIQGQFINSPVIYMYATSNAHNNAFNVGSLSSTGANPGSSAFTSRFIVRSTGVVGIGTTNPQTKLHVYGSANGVAHSNSQNQWIKTNLNTGSNYARFDMNGGGVAVGNGVTENPHHYLISYGTGHASTPEFAMKNNIGPLRFYTGPVGGSSEPRLSILTNGNVGIGTDNPSRKLDVYSTSVDVARFKRTTAGGGTKVAFENGDTNEYEFFMGGDETFRITYNSTSEFIRINPSGNVGIGTDNPQQKLHVQGAIRTNDLELSNLENPTGGNEVDGTRGHWCIQEGESDLYLINRLTGDKYTFNITKVN